MIITTKSNIEKFSCANPYFKEAFEALKKLEKEPFVKGRHEVNGDKIFINATEYDTHPKETAETEAHRKYIDVMWMISGKEVIESCDVNKLKNITKEYAESDDYLLAESEENNNVAYMTEACVCILFPEDAHSPGMDFGTTNHVKKLIAKVAVK